MLSFYLMLHPLFISVLPVFLSFHLFRMYPPGTYFGPSTVAPGTHQSRRSQRGSTLLRFSALEETDSKQASKQIRMTQSHLPIKHNLLIEGDKYFP